VSPAVYGGLYRISASLPTKLSHPEYPLFRCYNDAPILPNESPVKLIIKARKLIDGTGGDAVENGALLVEDGRITAVATRGDLEAGSVDRATVIDVPGGSIVPGLVETHAHMHCSADADTFRQVTTEPDDVLLLRAAQAVRAALASGVTTMRDLGSKNAVAFRIRQSIEDGIIPGPHLLVAGTPITTTAGHCHMFGTEADTEEQVVTAVRSQIKQGADCIKIMATGGNFTPRSNVRQVQYPASTLRAAVVDAERLGAPVASHCHSAQGVRNAVEAGVHTLVHCTWISDNPDRDFDYDPSVADAIAERGSFVDPTVAVSYQRQIDSPDLAIFQPGGIFADMDARYRILRDMWERGVRFVAGLDAGMQGGRFGDHAATAEVMVAKLGISPMDALVCATRNSADCLGMLNETGTLEAGKRADVLVLDGDAAEDVGALRLVNTVVKDGRIVKRDGRSLV